MVGELDIAFIGTRGIPASYGGFETCVEEVSVRLAARGHNVRVYCRKQDPRSAPKSYKGVVLENLPMLKKSFASSPFNSLISTAHVALSRCDIAHFFGCGNIPFIPAARMLAKRTVLTLDGLEWKRRSYSRFARAYLRSFQELATVLPDATVTDSKSSQRWYHERTGIMPLYVPYGATISDTIDEEILRKFQLERGQYILFTGRLVYEKGAHTLINAYKSVGGNVKLVIIGDYPGHSDYISQLKSIADDRTRFLGYVYGREYETLLNAALMYVHPSLLDGTSISLLGALGAGRCVISSDIRENMDVAGDAALYFITEDPDDLGAKA